MLWETLGFVVLGFAGGFGATRWLPDRLPSPLLVRVTGPCAALLGGWVAHSVLGPGNAVATLTVAAGVCVALVTLLVRPKPQPGTRSSTPRHA